MVQQYCGHYWRPISHWVWSLFGIFLPFFFIICFLLLLVLNGFLPKLIWFSLFLLSLFTCKKKKKKLYFLIFFFSNLKFFNFFEFFFSIWKRYLGFLFLFYFYFFFYNFKKIIKRFSLQKAHKYFLTKNNNVGVSTENYSSISLDIYDWIHPMSSW